jgi:hypothetical protein
MIRFALVISLAGAPEPEPQPEPEPSPAEAIPVAAEGPSAPAAPGPTQPSHVPDPHARPSEGVYAVGSSGVAPLPPAPPPVSPSTIPRGSWRGIGWLAIRMHVTGPIAGETPGRPTVISLGGGAEGGWRIRQWVGIGAGFARQPHEVYRADVPDAPATIDRRGYMTNWDIAFVRLYAPVPGRVDPYIDVGGGLAFFDPARDRASLVGGAVRGSIGLDVWITRSVTLGLAGLYRANFVDETVGHAWQGALELAVHW